MSGGERMQRPAGDVMFVNSDQKKKPRVPNAGSFEPGNPRNGARWRGKIPMPEHAHPLVRCLYAEMNKQHATIMEVAERAGVCRQMIWNWGRLRHPKLDAIEACFNVLGLRLVVESIDE